MMGFSVVCSTYIITSPLQQVSYLTHIFPVSLAVNPLGHRPQFLVVHVPQAALPQVLGFSNSHRAAFPGIEIVQIMVSMVYIYMFMAWHPFVDMVSPIHAALSRPGDYYTSRTRGWVTFLRPFLKDITLASSQCIREGFFCLWVSKSDLVFHF